MICIRKKVLLSFCIFLITLMMCVSGTFSYAAAYRTKGASKATPGFDVIDYGQEDYVFGDSDSNARHWSAWVLKALQENADVLETLFNQ